jgi:LPXTG-motif cell wall-anchored protein
MDTARYFIALLVIISLPPGLLLWFVIHPYASFWRRLGPGWTYGLLGIPVVGLMVGIFLARRWLLSVDFGTSYWLMVLGIASVTMAFLIAVKRRKHLGFGVLAGIPQLSAERYPGKLFREGIYGKVRHPRYMEILFAILGYALFANYLAPYVSLALTVPTVYLIVLMEERELHDRFGAEWEEYSRRVPRFVPKW